MRMYISAPITRGNHNHNFYVANEVHTRLIEHGIAVFNPILSMANFTAQQLLTWDQWLENDLEWVKVSDAVLRLPGESKGADLETRKATEWGIPVLEPSHFTFLDELFP